MLSGIFLEYNVFMYITQGTRYGAFPHDILLIIYYLLFTRTRWATFLHV